MFFRLKYMDFSQSQADVTLSPTIQSQNFITHPQQPAIKALIVFIFFPPSKYRDLEWDLKPSGTKTYAIKQLSFCKLQSAVIQPPC